MNLQEIKELLQIVDTAQIAELEIEQSGFRIKIRKFSETAPPTAVSAPPAHAVEPKPVLEAKPTLPANVVEVVAPMVGTFYRAPAPDAEPYVKLGETVEPGQVLFIIEAMKMMNEIESECRGKVVEILVENGAPVEYGQPLMRVQLTE